jgi:hypothetical protein
LLIDVAERPHRRPADKEKQKDLYSEKKNHTIKNTVIATVSTQILFVGDTFLCHCHDYTMLKTEFSLDKAWFETIRALLDSGYQVICNAFVSEKVEKPRKSKKNPVTSLTPEQKAHKQELSRVRILVENAIAGMKRFNILVHDFRNRRSRSGLWNFLLT